MKSLLPLITLILCASTIQAQKQPTQIREVAWEQFKAQEGNNWAIRWNEKTGLPRVLTGATTTKYTGEPEIAAKAFLMDNKGLFAFKTDLSDLRHIETKENRGVRHVTFQQSYKGLKVEGAQYKVHLREDGTVDMANGYYYDNIDIPIIPVISSLSASNTAMLDLELATSLFNKNTSELVIYPQNETFYLAYKIDVLVEDPFTDWQYFVDATNGRILNAYNQITPIYTASEVTRDKATKESTLKNKNLFVTGTGKVYRKHPGLSSVTTENLFGLDGNGKLDGTYVRVKNSSSSDAYSASHSFQYATSNTHFDEVSLYYHVDNFRRNFIEGLDSGNNLFNFIEAFAHNNTICPSNACFSPSTEDIYFSDNQYEFAKEDKIVHHEYSHKVVWDIESGIQSIGGEEGSISEGTPDYFAGSFTGRSKILEYSVPFAERDMSNPDISSYTDYQNDLNFPNVQSHRGGEFFSSILWDIRNNSNITNAEADFLVFDALYRVSGNPDFLEFRAAMIAADNATYGGSHLNILQDAFGNKGVGLPTPPLSVSIAGPTSVFAPGTYTYTANPNGGDDPYQSYTWEKRQGAFGSWVSLGTGRIKNISFSAPAFDAEIKVTVQDNSLNTASTSIIVVPYDCTAEGVSCKAVNEAVLLPEEFALESNYPNPFNPSTQINYSLPETSDVSFKIYNLMGQEVATLVNGPVQAGFHNVTFEAGNLASGIYIARIVANGTSGSQFVRSLKMQLIK